MLILFTKGHSNEKAAVRQFLSALLDQLQEEVEDQQRGR